MDELVPPGHTQIQCYMIFDIKFDFTRKTMFVTGGYLIEPPSSIMFSAVVTQDSVQIAFMLIALNRPDVPAANIGNAYLNAPCREKVYFIAGTEFGANNKGKKIIIIRTLYGLKSSSST